MNSRALTVTTNCPASSGPGMPTQTLKHWKHGGMKRDCPLCHGRELDQRTYAYVLGLYLGDGCLVATTKGCYNLSIACTASWPGLAQAAAAAVSTVMPLSVVRQRRRSGCIEILSQSKHWPCLFPQHGPGKKHTRKIELTAWQQEITTEFTEDFIRGLIHSDGCRSINRVKHSLKNTERWYEYPRYTFSQKSEDIKALFTDALDRLGIPWKVMNRMNISIAKKGAVARLDEFVGPKY